MNYDILKAVYPSGIAEIGLSAIVNDRNMSVWVPWTVPHSSCTIIWNVESDDGNTYIINVPVSISAQTVGGISGTLAEYTKGTYWVSTSS